MKIEVGQEYDFNPNLSSSYNKTCIELIRGKIKITQIYIEDNVTCIKTDWCGLVFDLNKFLECIEI